MRDEFYEAALTFAKSKGWNRDELPSGDRGSAHTCPLAIACGENWDPREVLLANPDRDLRSFVLRFDQGHYPQLIADQD